MKINLGAPFASATMTRASNPVDTHVGTRIRMLRQSRGIEPEALAVMIGATISEVQKYEFGERRITAEGLLGISRILNVPVSFFFENGAVLTTD